MMINMGCQAEMSNRLAMREAAVGNGIQVTSGMIGFLAVGFAVINVVCSARDVDGDSVILNSFFY